MKILKKEDIVILPVIMDMIALVIARATTEFPEYWGRERELIMDLALCNKLHRELNFGMFLTCDATDFAYDFVGIVNNWDRQNFVLTNGFVPKCGKGLR